MVCDTMKGSTVLIGNACYNLVMFNVCMVYLFFFVPFGIVGGGEISCRPRINVACTYYTLHVCFLALTVTFGNFVHCYFKNFF